jgi:hypothetical protein
MSTEPAAELPAEHHLDPSFVPKRKKSSDAPGPSDSSLGSSLTSLAWLPQAEPVAKLNLSNSCRNMKFDTIEEEQPTKVDWKTNADTKPPFSYITLIYRAIESMAKDKVTLSDIYGYITENYIWYQYCDQGWKA